MLRCLMPQLTTQHVEQKHVIQYAAFKADRGVPLCALLISRTDRDHRIVIYSIITHDHSIMKLRLTCVIAHHNGVKGVHICTRMIIVGNLK